MIKELWERFSKKPEPVKEVEQPVPVNSVEVDEPVASITFNIEEDGMIWIVGNWDGEHMTGHLLGEMLYRLNSGQMAELIQESLVEQADEEGDLEFIDCVLGTWQGAVQESSFNTAPMVHPLKTFEASRIP